MFKIKALLSKAFGAVPTTSDIIVKKPGKRRRAFFLLLALFHTVGALSSLDALMSSRTSQGSIAWIVSLNTFPYAAVPAYWVFGRSRFQGYVISRKEADNELVC